MHGQTHAAYQMLVNAYQCVLCRMHTRNVRALAGTALILGAGGALAPKVRAATLYWDTNGAVAGFGTAGGVWGTNTNWTTSATGVAVPGTLTTLAADDVNFGTAADGLAAGTVGVTGTQEVHSITFGAASGAVVLAGPGTIHFNGATPTITANVDATIGAVLTSETGLTVRGPGTLTLAGGGTLTGDTLVGTAGGVGGNGVAALITPVAGTPGTAGVAGNLTISNGILTVTNILGGVGGGGGNAGVGAALAGPGGAGGNAGDGVIEVSGGDVTVTSSILLGGNGGKGGNAGLGTVAGASGGAGGIGGTDTMLISGGNVITNTLVLGGNGGNGGNGASIIGLAAAGASGGAGGNGVLTLSSGSLQVLDDVQLGGSVGDPGTPGLINIVGANGGVGGAAGVGTFNLAGGTLTVGGNLVINDTVDTDSLTQTSTLNIGWDGNAATAAAGTLAIAGTITNDGAINFRQTDTVTLANDISGAGTLTQSGPGTTVLSGDNSYTGVTTISNGVLVLDSAGALPGGPSGTDVGLKSDLTISGGVVGLGNGNASFTRALGNSDAVGDGSVSFAGSGGFAAYTPNTIATVNLGGPNPLIWGSTPNFLGNADTLILGAADATGTVDFQNKLDLGAAQHTVQVGDGSADVDAILSGGLIGTTGGLNKTGAGTLALTGASSYTGDTHVSTGELIIGNDVTGGTLATGTVTVDGPATLTVGGGTAASSLTASGLFTNDGTFNIGDTLGAAGTAVANITGGLANGGTVTVNGPDGLLALTSDVTGAGTLATLAGGTLTLANGADIANDLDNAGTTTVQDGISTITGAIVNTGTLNVGDTVDGPGTAVLDITGAWANDGTVNVLSDGQLTGGDLTNNGTLTLTGDDADDVLVDTNVINTGTGALSGTGSISGDLSNAGAGSVALAGNVGGDLTNSGTGLGAAGVTVSGTVGGNLVSSGSGDTSVGGSITGDITNSGGGLIDLSSAGPGQQVVGGSLTNTSGTVLMGNNTDGTAASGVSIAGAVSNAGTLTVVGGSNDFLGGISSQTGTFNIGDGTGAPLSAVANVTGAWTNDGTVNVLSDGQLTGGALTNNGTLTVDGTIAANVTVTSTGSIGGAGGTTTGSLTLDNGSSLVGTEGSGTGNAAAGITALGPIIIAPDVKVLGSLGGSGVMDVLGTGTNNTLDLTAFDTSAFRGGNASGAGLTFESAGGGNFKIALTSTTDTSTWAAPGAAGTWDNTHGPGVWQNTLNDGYHSGDDVVFNDVVGQPTVTVTLGDTVTPSSMTFNNTSGTPGTSTAYVFDGPGQIAGTTGLTLDGSGTVTMNSDNTYTGDTVVNAGTLLVNGNTNNGAGNYTVGDGVGGPTATLGGTGTITLAGDGLTTGVFTVKDNGQLTGGNLAVTGTGNAGNGPGTNDPAAGDIGQLTINAAQTNLNGTYVFDVDYGDLGGGDQAGDLLSFTGDVDLTGAVFQIGEEFGHTRAGEHYYIKIFESATLPTGGPPTFVLSAEALARGQSVVTWDGGKTYYLVPEPASFALLALGSLLLLRRPSRRRGRKSSVAA